MRRTWRLASVVLIYAALAVAVGGCRYVEELLEQPEPTLDPRQVFPGFTGSSPSTAQENPPTLWDFSPCDDGGSRRFRLGDLFTAELPQGDGWAVAESAQATILVRYPPDSSIPASFLYAERTDPERFGVGLQRFHGRVDQRLGSSLPHPFSDFFGRLSEDAAQVAEASPEEALPEEASAAQSVDSPTQADSPLSGEAIPEGGEAQTDPMAEADPGVLEQAAGEAEDVPATLAPGYISKEGSFTGWRWIGECAVPQSEAGEEQAGEEPGAPTGGAQGGALKPFLRLSRSRGDWRLQPGARPVSAFLVLAVVTLPKRWDHGVHLAIVCTDLPRCEDAPAFARLLGSIRVAIGSSASGGSWGSDTLRDLAEEVGVTLASGARPPSTAEFRSTE